MVKGQLRALGTPQHLKVWHKFERELLVCCKLVWLAFCVHFHLFNYYLISVFSEQVWQRVRNHSSTRSEGIWQ